MGQKASSTARDRITNSMSSVCAENREIVPSDYFSFQLQFDTQRRSQPKYGIQPVRVGVMLFRPYELLFRRQLDDCWKKTLHVRLINEYRDGKQSEHWKTFGGLAEFDRGIDSDISLRRVLKRETSEECCKGKLISRSDVVPSYIIPDLTSQISDSKLIIFYAGEAGAMRDPEGLLQDIEDGVDIKWKDFPISALDKLVTEGAPGITQETAKLRPETKMAIDDLCMKTPPTYLPFRSYELGMPCNYEGELIISNEMAWAVKQQLNIDWLDITTDLTSCKVYFSVPYENGVMTNIIELFFEVGPLIYHDRFCTSYPINTEDFTDSQIKMAVANEIRTNYEQIITNKIPSLFSR